MSYGCIKDLFQKVLYYVHNILLVVFDAGNKEAKHSYIGVISALLNYCVENSQLLDIAMQLLVYITIHPALKEDRQ